MAAKLSIRFVVVLMLLCLLQVVNCGAAPVQLVFMDWWGPPRSDGYLEIIKLFEVENPHIGVEYLAGNYDKALTMVAAGTPPDILAVNQQQLSGALGQGLARPLDDFLRRDGIQVSRVFLPGALEGLTYKGALYGLPKVYNPTHMFVNRDLLDETGLSVPGLGWTTRDFEDYLRKLTIIGPGGQIERHGMTSPDYRTNGWIFVHGGDYLDASTRLMAAMDDRVTRVLDWLAELGQKGLWGPVGRSAFINRKAAFFNEAWLTQVPTVMNDQPGFRVQTVYMPRGDAPTITFVTIHPHLITTGSKHPEEAWQFLKFLNLSPEANEIRAAFSLAPGTVSGMRQLVDKAMLPANQVRDEVYRVFLQPTTNIVGMPRVEPGFSDAANQYIWPAIDKVLKGTIGARPAMEEIIEPVNSVLRAARGK